MGFSTADQMNPTPMIKGGPAAYSEDLQAPGLPDGLQVGFTRPNPNFDDTLGMGSPGTASPGMGGKGGVAGDPMMGAQQMNIPQPTPMNPPQTGLPGLPVPVAPMTPIGPGLGNPGGPGVQPQQQMAPPPPMPPTFNTAKPMMRGGPARPIFDQLNQGRMMPGRGAQPARPGSMARPQPMRGAGRGGMIR